jgi:hypothetical protein
MEQSTRRNAMAFYNPKGLVPAFKHAKAFAGKDGRVATLPDIIEARLATEPGDFSWETYFTTLSAEYIGLSKAGNPIAIVAHGIGPMSTLDGVLAAYSYQFNDKERNNYGGRISQEDFLKLESGTYGDVAVIDLVATWNRRPYQFSGHAVTTKEITEEPLWQARLGKKWREYVEHHSACARKWDEEYHRSYERPCILGMDAAANCGYSTRELFDRQIEKAPGKAVAHLLSIGRLVHSTHQYYEYDYERREYRDSLVSDVDCHGWSDGTRMLGIQPGTGVSVHPGIPSYSKLVEKHLEKLWGPNPKGAKDTVNGFWHLVKMGKQHLTDYPKQGDGMDNHEPEFLITKIERVGKPKQFRTTIGGYHGFFKYGIDEVRRIAPPEANAYTVGDDIAISGEDHVARITFYQVTVDTTQRLVRMDDIYRDYDLLMSLID